MKIEHNGLAVDLPDDWCDWWTEAGMVDFAPTSRAYRVNLGDARNPTFCEVCIQDIKPVRRTIGIFRDDIENGIPARERVIKILRGFRRGDAIAAVPVLPAGLDSPHKYKLVDGTHRLYCSLAAGFTHVPTIKGFDLNAY